MSIEEKKDFFKRFFREFKQGLRKTDQDILELFIKDLVTISMQVPPLKKDYSFREVLLLISLLNEKKISKVNEKIKIIEKKIKL